jgi:ribosomal-protein-alanine N-acetyltransferase
MTEPYAYIRPLGPLDLMEAVRIHREAFGSEAWDQRAILEILAMPGAGGLMAVDPQAGDLRILGFALYLFVAEDAELLTIAVRRNARRNGVATSLMEHFLALAAGIGATAAFLEVAEDNGPAQRLYGMLGFKMEGTRPNYYHRPGNKMISARLLRRPIAGPTR